MTNWDTYAVCPGCERKFLVPFGDTRHLHFEVCPTCGEGNARRSRFAEGSGWRVGTFRVIDGRWFERGVATPDDILAAEAAEDASFRRGCFAAIALFVAAVAALLWSILA